MVGDDGLQQYASPLSFVYSLLISYQMKLEGRLFTVVVEKGLLSILPASFGEYGSRN